MLILTLFVKNGGGYLSLLWYHMNFRIFFYYWDLILRIT